MQCVHSLSDRDKEVGSQFCHHFRGILPENPVLPNSLLMSEEAHFHLHDTVNKQKFRYSSDANRNQLHQRPLYDPNVTVWWPHHSLWFQQDGATAHTAVISVAVLRRLFS